MDKSDFNETKFCACCGKWVKDCRHSQHRLTEGSMRASGTKKYNPLDSNAPFHFPHGPTKSMDIPFDKYSNPDTWSENRGKMTTKEYDEKVTLLETSKALKRAGCGASAEYKWCGLKTSKYILNQEIPDTAEIKWFLVHKSDPRFYAHSEAWVSEFYYAYSSDDLIEELPMGITIFRFYAASGTSMCSVGYADMSCNYFSLREALAHLYIELKKQNLT